MARVYRYEKVPRFYRLHCFKRAGINTIGDLCSKIPEEVGHIRNLSRSQLELVLEKLKERGCMLKQV